MQRQKLEKFKCELTIREYSLIGQSITTNFPSGFPDAALKVQLEFVERRSEIMNSKDKEVLFSPYMCNGIIATYFACLEVSDLTDIPEGMIGFTLPSQTYAKINCTNKSIGEAYDRIFKWMNEKGYVQRFLENTCPIEIFYFEDNVEEEDVEILIPVGT
ncbi:GyrI-like domain-containing protein [Paenibacillus lentus]|uniref:GyrI-like domain-containing protein n=1 Tax=Paenibacillus lentus TaxID=1338368 RepID=UPI003657C22D